jgi:hypothetical protein
MFFNTANAKATWLSERRQQVVSAAFSAFAIICAMWGVTSIFRNSFAKRALKVC